MSGFEREKYGLDQLENEPDETRLVIILEENGHVAKLWVEAFSEVPNLRCIVPKPRRGYAKALIETVKPEQTVLVVADRFVENVFVHCETSDFLDWLRAMNPEAFILETSIVDFGRCKYGVSNTFMCSFFDRLPPAIKAIKETDQNFWPAKIYTLQTMAVPELLEAKRLDTMKQGDITENELFELFIRLMANNQYHEMLSRIEIDSDEIEELFGRLGFQSALVFLHCAYSIIGQLNLDHDEKYFLMAVSRIKILLEDFRK